MHGISGSGERRQDDAPPIPHHDRADAVATAVIQIFAEAVRAWFHGEPLDLLTVRCTIAACLRDEFHDIERQLAGDRRDFDREHLSAAKQDIAAGDASLRSAADHIYAAIEAGARQVDVAATVNKSQAWISRLLAWRANNFLAAGPFADESKAKRQRANYQAPDNSKPKPGPKPANTAEEALARARAEQAKLKPRKQRPTLPKQKRTPPRLGPRRRKPTPKLAPAPSASGAAGTKPRSTAPIATCW